MELKMNYSKTTKKTRKEIRITRKDTNFPLDKTCLFFYSSVYDVLKRKIKSKEEKSNCEIPI